MFSDKINTLLRLLSTISLICKYKTRKHEPFTKIVRVDWIITAERKSLSTLLERGTIKSLAMLFIKFFIVFILLNGIVCFSTNTTKKKKPALALKLEEAAIKILTTCYKDVDKTLVVLGRFSENFVTRISSLESFNVVLLDPKTRPMKNIVYSSGFYKTTYKTHIVIILASEMKTFIASLQTYLNSAYFNHMASILGISFPSKKGMSNEDVRIEALNMMFSANIHNMINIDMLYSDDKKIWLFGSNPFIPKAPKPWFRIVSANIPNRIPPLTAFVRNYLESEKICENLHFDKTRNLGGFAIETIHMCSPPYCNKSQEKHEEKNDSIRMKILRRKSTGFIEPFFKYVNANQKILWVEIVSGKNYNYKPKYFVTRTQLLRVKVERNQYIYPHGEVCMFLVTKFRGNKSQLQKILSLIDGYSWIGLFIISISNLIFFKYFLCSPLIDAFLNIVRLICNSGVLTTPSNLALQIYLASLLMVVVTMQGIFASNLASLLTQDIPVQQVNSIDDLVDLEYKIYAPKTFFVLFNGIVPKERIFEMVSDTTCLLYLSQNPEIACFDHMPNLKDLSRKLNFYISDCVTTEYYTHSIPRYFPFEEILNKFLRIIIEAGIKTDLEMIVEEKILREFDAEEDILEPRSINFDDLKFAFLLLAIGLSFAFIVFLIESIIYRYQRRVTTTRIVVLK